MKILALEFSSAQRSVAVLRDSEMEINEVVETGPGATRSLSLVDESLRRSKLEREQIECVVVGIGPGSYTGVRAAIALAQGWQLARGIHLLGISSVECIVAQAQTEGLTGRVSCVIDAQRDEFYLASYELLSNFANKESTARTGVDSVSVPATKTEGWRKIEPLQLVPLAQMRERERTGEVLIGPEVTRWFAAGRTMFPRAAALATLALRENDFVAGENLQPIYLRETSFVKTPPARIQF